MLKAEIEYDIVALGLEPPKIAAIIKDATGITVDPNATNFLQALNTTQLEAVRKRLAASAGWRRSRNA